MSAPASEQVAAIRSRLVRFGLAQALLDVQFWLPLWLIFLLDRGFSLGQAALADMVFRVCVVALELPMGAICDRIGRQRAYTLVCILTALTFTGITWVHNLPSLLAVWVLWAVQWATASGLGGALGYDLAAELPEEARRRAFSWIRAASAVGVLASLAAAGPLYAIHPSLPFWLTAGLALVSGALTLGLPVAPRRERESFGEVFRRPRTVWLVVLAAGLLLVGWPVQILYQPLGIELGLGATATSWMYVAMAAASLVGALAAGRVRSSSSGWQLGGGVLILLACGAIGLAPQLGPWILLPVLSLAYATATTLTEYRIAVAAGHDHRAAGLSVVSLSAGLFIAVARPGLLLVSGDRGAGAAFGLWGLVGIIPLAVMVLAVVKLRRLDRAPA